MDGKQKQKNQSLDSLYVYVCDYSVEIEALK